MNVNYYVFLTVSHWSTEDTMVEYVGKVLVPYFTTVRRNLNLAHDHPALVILDVFAAHRTEAFLSKMKENHIWTRFIPGGCTGELQPLDVAVNDVFKKKLKDRFSTFYAKKVQESLEKGIQLENIKIDLNTSTIKPCHARWMVAVLQELAREKELIKSAWSRSGIWEKVKEVVPVCEVEQPTARMGLFDVMMANKI